MSIFIDGKTYEADPSQNLLHACLSLGFDLPYFCWHPALGSVGACRQCAVKQFKDEKDQRGRIVMACLTPVGDGTRISIQDPEAAAFRAAVIEGLMLHHPHDCPVCDEGGECHLQDMTVMTGHDYRRYPFQKRTFRNQYLGPLVNHEMNRCIQCYRCVRFYREYAGGADFNVFALRDITYFGRHEDGVLESEFSGNLVEVCPTGVFTDRTLKRHYTRKWDLQMAPSICVHCGLGCNISAAERYGELRRVINRYNGEVNGYFICDRGRFGYEFVNRPNRIREPRLRRDVATEAAARSQALEYLRTVLSGNRSMIGIGSPRASLESNFALRTLVGPERFFAGVADEELHLLSTMIAILRRGPAPSASLRDVELSDAVVILGEDLTQVAARMALSVRQSARQQPMAAAEKLHIPLWLDHAVRQAVQDAQGPLFIATPQPTRLDDVATEAFRAAPDDIARLMFHVEHLLDARSPAVPELRDEASSLAHRMAQALRSSKRPLIIAGPSCNNEAIIQAAASVASSLRGMGLPARLAFTMPECNSCGLALMAERGLNAAFTAVRAGAAATAIILENDLYRRLRQDWVDDFFTSCRQVIALDSFENPTTAKAELVLPAATFAEGDGTLVSSEGRAQRFFQVFDRGCGGDIQESWRWLRDASAGRAEAANWQSLDDVIAALASSIPALSRITEAAPDSRLRKAGAKIPREPHRYSGRTAMYADISVHEPKPPDDPDSPLAFSMEGYPGQPPAALTPFFWAPGWNSIQAANKFQSEIAGQLRGGDPGVRLIEPIAETVGQASPPVSRGQARRPVLPWNPAFKPRVEEWLIVPLFHLFGSEELSMAAPAIEELAPKPYVLLRPDDARRIGVEAGQQVELALSGWNRHFPVKLEAGLPRGVAGFPVGLTGAGAIALPAWGRILRLPPQTI